MRASTVSSCLTTRGVKDRWFGNSQIGRDGGQDSVDGAARKGREYRRLWLLGGAAWSTRTLSTLAQVFSPLSRRGSDGDVGLDPVLIQCVISKQRPRYAETRYRSSAPTRCVATCAWRERKLGLRRVDAVKTHDAAVEAVYQRSPSRLVGLSTTPGGNRQAEDDIVQEAFVRLLSNADRVLSCEEPEGWVRGGRPPSRQQAAPAPGRPPRVGTPRRAPVADGAGRVLASHRRRRRPRRRTHASRRTSEQQSSCTTRSTCPSRPWPKRSACDRLCTPRVATAVAESPPAAVSSWSRRGLRRRKAIEVGPDRPARPGCALSVGRFCRSTRQLDRQRQRRVC